MSYDLTVQFDDEATRTTTLSVVEEILSAYPGTQRVTPHQWIYKPCPAIHVEFDLVPTDDDSESIHTIGVGVPYPFLSASGEPALRLCLALAERLGWRVFDEQLGEYVGSADIAKLVLKQADFGNTAEKLVMGTTRFEKWLDRWGHAATHQSLSFLFIAITLAALGAVAIVVPLDVQEDKTATYLFWTGLPIGLAIFTIKMTCDAWIARRRRIGKKGRTTNR